MSQMRREKKYQMIKLMQSGRSLREISALNKSVAVALTKEYSDQNKVENLLKLEGGIRSITATRNDAKQLMKINFERSKPMLSTKEEVASKFVTGWQGNTQINWKRDGNLVKRTKRVNPPRKGSSVGKIGRTSITGSGRVLKDFRSLIRELRKLQQVQGNKGDMKGLQKAYKGLRADVSRTIT